MNILKQHIPYKFQFILTHIKQSLTPGGFIRTSYSADGEDLLLEKQLFGDKKKGFYVDVGSLHPKYVSNTYKLYKRGWTGINIDPNPNTQNLFRFYRKNDINLQLGVAQNTKELTYYEFEYPGLNTIDEKYALYRMKNKGNTLKRTSKIQCLSLSEIFEKYLPKNTKIDLLDIDVEGFDLDVLMSNNWKKYSPSVILVEDRDFRTKLKSSKIYQFLAENGYKFYAYSNITLIVTKDKK